MRMALAGKVVCAWTAVTAMRATPMSVEQASFLNMKVSPLKIFSLKRNCDALFKSTAVLFQNASIDFDAKAGP